MGERRTKSLSKRKFKLLKKIDGQVRAMLKENEKVYFLSSGVESSLTESFFLGWVMYYINRMAFVFTTQRILLLQISSRGDPLDLKSQIRYPNMMKIGRTALGNCKITLRNGKTLVFVKVHRKDRKFMQKATEYLRSSASTPSIDGNGKENLCPYCYLAVESFPRECPHCHKGFKSASKAGWLSLLFPGFGDFYLGHRKFAIWETLGAALVWFSLFLPGEEFIDPSGRLTAGLTIFACMHGIDALVTRQVARKGIYPSIK